MSNSRDARRRVPRPLGRSVSIVVGIAAVGFLAIVIAVFALGQIRMLKHAEDVHVEDQTKVIHGALNTVLDNLHSNTRTWSSWDETYSYAQGTNDDFIPINLENGLMLEMYKVDYVIIKDLAQNDLYIGSTSKLVDGVRPVLPDGVSEHINDISKSVIVNHMMLTEKAEIATPYCDTGFIVWEDKSYLICTMPILPNTEKGADPSGTYSFLVTYDDEQIRALTGLETYKFEIIEQDPQNPLTENTFFYSDKEMLTTRTILKNLGSDRSVILQFEHPRSIFSSGYPLIFGTSAMFTGAVVLLILLLLAVLNVIVLRPIKTLSADVDAADERDLLDLDRHAKHLEIFRLASSINDMLHRLNESHEAVAKTQVSFTVLQTILNGLDGLIFAADPDTGEILFVNEAMKQHFGTDREYVGETCWSIFQKGMTKKCDFCPCLTHDMDSDEVYFWEELNVNNGRHYEKSSRYIEWPGGKKVHLQYMADVTEKRMMDALVRKRLEQQNLMTDISRSFLMEADVDNSTQEALNKTGEFLGLSLISVYALEREGRTLTHHTTWADSSAAPHEMPREIQLEDDLYLRLCCVKDEDAFFSGAEGDGVLRLMRENGVSEKNETLVPIFVSGEFWGAMYFARKTGSADWDENDLSLMSLLANIVSQALSKSETDEENRLLSTIVESSPLFISYADPMGDIVYVNPGACAITGYSSEELVQGGMGLLFGEDTAVLIRDEWIPNVIRNGQGSYEALIRRKDGQERTLTVSVFVTMGEEMNLGCIATDITDIRRLEADLVTAKETAEQNSRAKSDFLSRMSHEMRTPMNAIIGMTNIALNSPNAAKKEDCLNKIDNASHHLLGVINDILDMSKIEANKLELSCTDFKFSALIANLKNVVSYQMEAKSQAFAVNTAEGVPEYLSGDEMRITQVLVNLITNASKFTPEGGSIAVDVRLAGQEGGECMLEVAVTDTGIGISQDRQGRLFQSFEQADGTIARRFGGTGLGLAISRGIARLMNGDITLVSEEGTGSTFTFTFSAQIRTESDVADGGASESELLNRDFTGRRILLAEDVEINREIVLAILEDTGIVIDIAEDGRQAIEMYSVHRGEYDLVFMDIHMPEIDGLEAARAIRRIEGETGRRVPIVAMTASAFKEDVDKCLEVGMDDHIGKPLDFSEVIRKMNKYL